MDKHILPAVAGAVLFGLGDLLRRVAEDGARSPVALATASQEHAGPWLAAAVAMVAGSALLLMTVAGTIREARGQARGRALVRVGGGLFWIGLVASIGHAVAFFGLSSVWGAAGVGGSTVSALDKASESLPLLVGMILLFLLGMTLGQLLWVGGLWRAGRVPVWALAAAVVDVVAGATGGVPAGVVGVLAWAALGLAVGRALRPRDQAGAPRAPEQATAHAVA